MDCDSFVLSIKTENVIIDLKKLEDIFDFSNLEENYELFSIKKKKVTGKFKIQFPKIFRKNEIIALRSKCYASKCGDYSKNELKGIFYSQTKNVEFVGYKICLVGEENENESD